MVIFGTGFRDYLTNSNPTSTFLTTWASRKDSLPFSGAGLKQTSIQTNHVLGFLLVTVQTAGKLILSFHNFCVNALRLCREVLIIIIIIIIIIISAYDWLECRIIHISC